MHRLTVDDLIGEIAKLDKSQVYRYYSGKTLLKIAEIRSPHGPIRFMRWESDSAMSAGKPGSISSRMLATFASVCSNRPYYPIHIDRLFSAGGNSRSALETLLAYTPHFFMCFPERVDSHTGSQMMGIEYRPLSR